MKSRRPRKTIGRPADVPSLCPAQQRPFQDLRDSRACGSVFVLKGREGSGRTTVARALARETGAGYLSALDLLESMKNAHPFRIEDEWCQAILRELRKRKALVVDDFETASFMAGGCHFYPRNGYLEVGVRAICDEADRMGAWILFVGDATSALDQRATAYGIPKFKLADQEFLFRAVLGPKAAGRLNFREISKNKDVLAEAVSKASAHFGKGRRRRRPWSSGAEIDEMVEQYREETDEA